tara:strand:- start:98 stop:1186 length:1089 start_codon:yes stop_codon:yes gene_type:complete
MEAMAQFALTNQTKEPQPVAKNIGSISELNGVTRVVREKPLKSELGFSLDSMDKLETAAGRMGVTFLDETTIRLTENSTVIVDSYIFDPNPSNSSMALNFVKGTGRFISSKSKGIKKENIKIRAGNSATVGIRGTDLTLTVKDTGEVLVILLPDEFGESSGEIIVTTALGSVVLNKPYQATTVYNLESVPSNPIILDLTLDQIDNYLIVSPPEEKQLETNESSATASSSILDTDFLDFDELEQDDLAEDDLEYQELDIDYLATNFLEDLLDVIQEVDELSKASGALAKQGLEGTSIGYDSDTQISSFVTDSEVKLIREVEGKLQIQVSKDSSTAIRIDQEGKVNQVRVNGGTQSYINIKQGS